MEPYSCPTQATPSSWKVKTDGCFSVFCSVGKWRYEVNVIYRKFLHYLFIKTWMVFILVYSSGSIPTPDGAMESIRWTGPDPVFYWSLDNLDGLMLMEGTQQKNYDGLTEGKVGHEQEFCYPRHGPFVVGCGFCRPMFSWRSFAYS